MRQHPCIKFESWLAQTPKITTAYRSKNQIPSSRTTLANIKANGYKSQKYQKVSSIGTLTISRNLHHSHHCQLKHQQANRNQKSLIINTWSACSKALRNWVCRSCDNDKLFMMIKTSVSIGWLELIWRQPLRTICLPSISLGHSSLSLSCIRAKICQPFPRQKARLMSWWIIGTVWLYSPLPVIWLPNHY